MRRIEPRIGLLGGLLGLLLLLGAATPARAAHCDDACHEARRICHRATHAALRECRQSCPDALEEATARALRACEERGLAREECAALVERAVAAAVHACRSECRETYEQARARCHRAKLACGRLCRLPHDPACVADCRAELAVCQEQLDGCVYECREKYKATVEACFAGHDGVCLGPGELRKCLHEARREARACAHGCYDTFTCCEDFGDCLRSCLLEPVPIELQPPSE